MKTPEEIFADGFLAGASTGNGYMESLDAELTNLRRDNDRLKCEVFDLRRRLNASEAQAELLANENAGLNRLLRDHKEKIAELLRSPLSDLRGTGFSPTAPAPWRKREGGL